MIYSLGNLFRICLLRKYVQIFLGEEMEEKISWKEVFLYGGLFLLNTSLSLMLHLVWLNICINLAGIGLIVSLYTKSLKSNMFITFSIYLVHMGCDVITSFLMGDVVPGRINPVSAVTTVFLIFICVLLMERLVNDSRLPRGSASPQSAGVLVLVPFSSIIAVWMLVSMANSWNNRITVIIACFILLVLNFLVFFLYDMLRKAFSQQYENEILRQKVLVYANQMDIILQNENRVKALRHDMKHHMNELKLLAIKNGDMLIQEYIDSMEEFIENPKEIVSSGNMEIDSVLNYMLAKAKEELKEVKIDMQLPEAVSHSFDINVILGNLLENAIEAARETEEKLLNVRIRLKQGVLRIEVENSFDKTLISTAETSVSKNSVEGKGNSRKDAGRRNPRFLTTKKDTKMHGLGLDSVGKMVEKHNGIMEAYPEGKRFYVKLILYI